MENDGNKLAPDEGQSTYHIYPTNAVQAPHVRVMLKRALEFPNVWHSTEHINNANKLKFETGLPDAGPWHLTKSELRTLVIVLDWFAAKREHNDSYKSAEQWIKELHREIERDIRAAYRSACRTDGGE